MKPLVVKHDREERTRHMQFAILAQPAFVINEPEVAELIHKETQPRGGGADHLGERFLTALSSPFPIETSYEETPLRKMFANRRSTHFTRSWP